MEASSACRKPNQTWKIIQIFKKECLHFSSHRPGLFGKTCRQLVIEGKGYFPICIENQAIICRVLHRTSVNTLEWLSMIFGEERKMIFT
jgi:hypothetical protein